MFHITKVILYFLQKKEKFEGHAYEDANLYLKISIDACLLFDFAHISQKINSLASFNNIIVGRSGLMVVDLPTESII